MTLKVLLPLRDFPDGATVTKKTGQVQLTVRSEITVYNENRTRQVIKPNDGCRFLLDDRGNINAYSGDTEFLWCVDAEYFYRFLEDIMEGPSQ